MNQSESRLFDELRVQFQSANLRKVDVKQKVWDRLSQQNPHYGDGKMKTKIKTKMAFIVAACMIFLVSTAYAAVQIYQISNENGQIVYQARQENEQDHPIIIKEPDPERVQQQMNMTTDFTAFSQEIEGFASIPNKLAESFEFQKGAIVYTGAEHTKEKILTVNAFYESDHGQLILMVKKADPQETVYTMSIELEKVKLRNSEAVYKVIERPAGGKLQQLTWVKGENTLYSLQSASEEITKSDLVGIADTF